MRNRKYLIGVVAGVIGALAFSGVASAAILGQTETSVVAPSKLPKKTYKGATQSNIIATQLNDPANTSPPKKTVFTFDKNVKFTLGNLPVCPLSALQGTVEAAAAQCATSVVGQGSVQATTATGILSGPVSLIASPPNTLYVKARVGALNLPPLTGIYAGKTLTFDNLPNVPGTILSNFTTAFNKVKTGGKNFFFMARCSNKKLVVSETTTYYNGQSTTANSTQKCKQTKK
ncbi:MAG TPA: hypothetical protein VKD72_03740 [Gemmataceae bacterium]|nr:hypothetical protein [Gemmataceae bacterium]